MTSLVAYFLRRPVVANALMFGILFSSVVLWPKIGKEEMPEFAMSSIRISLRYPGASASDVELFVVKPVEEKLKGVTALKEVTSSSSYSTASFRVTFEPNIENLPEKIQEVKDAVDSVDLPSEVDEPIYRQFKSSEKAIIDIGMFLKDSEILSVNERQKLQEYALAFKNKILTLPEISGVEVSGYLRPELQVKVKPDLLQRYEVSMGQVKEQIESQNIRRPIGSLKDKAETEVSMISELNNISSLKDVNILAGFQGQRLKLGKIAEVEEGFEEDTTIHKVQGREGLIFNIQKSANVDILTAKDAVEGFIGNFLAGGDSPIDLVLIDDESYDVKNRLNLIGSNGLIGFILIVLILFFFLDFRASVWVAMGIPFSLAFTLICAFIMGYTINNMTLAAIIIVLGIVVDDAIIIAENITRRRRNPSVSESTGAVLDVGAPVIASVLTTCVAFIPLYFFSGRFGLFVRWIPAIIFLMLVASLIESFFILPSHLTHKSSLERLLDRMSFGNKFSGFRNSFVSRLEKIYSWMISNVLKFRTLALVVFTLLLATSYWIFDQKISFVMFPREESRDFRIKVTAADDVLRLEMARLVRQVEDIFLEDGRGIVTSVRTTIGQNRRGGEVKENEASVRVEIVPATERDVSFKKLLSDWEAKAKQLKAFTEIRFMKSRFGSDSGSPIAIQISENNDRKRDELSSALLEKLKSVEGLTNVELEKPLNKREYKLELNKDQLSRLGVTYSDLASTLRSYIEGDILYTFNNGEEEVDVRFTSLDLSKDNLEKLLDLSVANREGYLIPIKGLVKVVVGQKQATIERVNFRRSTMLFADLEKETKRTPLDIAEEVETYLLPKLLQGSPSSSVQFRGEVEDSRESESDFLFSIILILGLIYLLLIFLFDSIWTPLLIGAIIPFGGVGFVLAFWAHGLDQFGFFAVIGTLGMIGVVINDSIVLIDKLEKSDLRKEELLSQISEVSVSRLRAILITTITTVCGLFPTAYGFGGYDSMLSEMMLAMGWGLLFGMFITLFLVPCLYSFYAQIKGYATKEDV